MGGNSHVSILLNGKFVPCIYHHHTIFVDEHVGTSILYEWTPFVGWINRREVVYLL